MTQRDGRKFVSCVKSAFGKTDSLYDDSKETSGNAAGECLRRKCEKGRYFHLILNENETKEKKRISNKELYKKKKFLSLNP